MQLSPNFTFAEMCKSQTALRLGIPNQPGPEQTENLQRLCETILQPVRDEFGPVFISSGYRSPELCVNIGSTLTSQHIDGNAADFEVPGLDNYELALWIKTHLPFDQLILEHYTGGNSGWVHCSYAEPARQDALSYNRKDGYRQGLIRPA